MENYIEDIKIKNFKCLSETEKICFKYPTDKNNGLNIFIGENNSGKTSMLDAIYKVKQETWEDDEIYKGNEKNNEEKAIIINKSTKILKESEDDKITKEKCDNYKIQKIRGNRMFPGKYGNSITMTRGLHSQEESKKKVSDPDNLYSNLLLNLNEIEKDEMNEIIRKIFPEYQSLIFKNNNTHIKSNELTTTIENAGSGIYNIIKIAESLVCKETKVLLIDEPEVYLHPRAQLELGKILLEKSKEKQIFITTHSSLLFKECIKGNDPANLFIFKKENNKININKYEDKEKIFKFSPTWSEIMYKAYNIPTIDLHIELYTFITEKISEGESFKKAETNDEDFTSAKTYYYQNRKGEFEPRTKYTIQEYIRHCIHHPENKKTRNDCGDDNKESCIIDKGETIENENFFSKSDLKQSIDEMIKYIRKKYK